MKFLNREDFIPYKSPLKRKKNIFQNVICENIPQIFFHFRVKKNVHIFYYFRYEIH